MVSPRPILRLVLKHACPDIWDMMWGHSQPFQLTGRFYAHAPAKPMSELHHAGSSFNS